MDYKRKKVIMNALHKDRRACLVMLAIMELQENGTYPTNATVRELVDRDEDRLNTRLDDITKEMFLLQ